MLTVSYKAFDKGYENSRNDLQTAGRMGSQPERKENDSEKPDRQAAEQIPCFGSRGG